MSKGIKNSEKFKLWNLNFNKGKKLSEDTKKKIGLAVTKRYDRIGRKIDNKVSLRLRFKVFARDNFTCQYCGRKAPEVVLHADHIVPMSKGGHTEINNVVTACYECNLGKSNLIINYKLSG